jgi:hypothetical protein
MGIDKNAISRKYKKLYYCISAILFENDIEGINFKTNDNEYEPEVETIQPRLCETETIEDIQLVVQEEFARWFGEKRELDEFYIVAKEIWTAWNTYRSGMS